MMLPEQVLGQALLYLVAAVGRRVVFSDPRRFAAALYDEAWALLASPHGQNLLIEGVRDGRKHNGAIWLASQHPNDFAISELDGPARVAVRVPPGPAGDPGGARGSSAWPTASTPPPRWSTGSATGSACTATCASGSGSSRSCRRRCPRSWRRSRRLPPPRRRVARRATRATTSRPTTWSRPPPPSPAAAASWCAPRALAVPAPSDDGGLALPDELDDDGFALPDELDDDGLSLADELDDDGLAVADELDDDGFALPDELDDVPVRRVDPGEAPALPVDNGAAPDDLSAARARARRRRRSPLAAALQPEEP